MKSQYVHTLKEGDYVNDYFVATRKDLRNRQTGGKFLGMVFQDKTGDIGGVMWNNAIEIARVFEVGDVVSVRGRVQSYQGRLQIQVDQVLPLREGDFNSADLVAVNEDSEDNWEKFLAVLNSIKDPWLSKLRDLLLEDTAFIEEFRHAAAAKKWHHEYRGGLVRHCHEMATIAETMCVLYPDLNRDLLLLSVFLHDAGKVDEMTHDLVVDYTTAGKLIGHLQIGCDLVQEKMRLIEGFPEKLRLEILHCILSHHGELVNGSPMVPKTLEAIVLHHIDNLDAQAAAFTRIIREARANGQEWSEYQPLIERVVWAK